MNLKLKETLANILTTLTERGKAGTATATVNVSAGIGTVSKGASITLPAGTYLLLASAAFPTGSGARNLSVGIYQGSTEFSVTRVVSAYGDWAQLQTHELRTLTTRSTVQAGASSSVAVNGVRLKLQYVRVS